MLFDKRDKYEWHTIFVWWPIHLQPGLWVWMEFIQRKYHHYPNGIIGRGWSPIDKPEYRPLKRRATTDSLIEE